MFYTDYPFVELGDKPGEKAPTRKVRIIRYDGNKYVDILVGGILTSVKCGYIYKENLEETPHYTIATIADIMAAIEEYTNGS